MSEIPTRCPWVDTTKPDYIAYHDLEWGVPLHDDNQIFEFLVLESAQAGLSWYTILRKRENYRKAFANFDPTIIATFDEAQVEKLMGNAGIVRNRRKIEAAINNAQRFLDVQAEFGSFADYIWGFVGGAPKTNHIESLSDYPVTTQESDKLAKDLKKRGFKFLGSTTIYAHMQATGMVNDHSIDCFRRAEIMEANADS
ncbi:DNA-3-methyladenine glycosylase I [Photobacterium chitinilyticum]|uniref:DNA-3-methyladenine glycosylase I n=1 Tax=Photobacterium chitinilyticum TaxID=2485123 RepID=A0A444JWF2_9GAMM|nr:DNA-3-methyladenine glycosylase I [Photobacterium chitinilyticum]RWX57397.1 DNA-3-methyladenine glycosylase I [Photobacterium chitinilyticum]